MDICTDARATSAYLMGDNSFFNGFQMFYQFNDIDGKLYRKILEFRLRHITHLALLFYTANRPVGN